MHNKYCKGQVPIFKETGEVLLRLLVVSLMLLPVAAVGNQKREFSDEFLKELSTEFKLPSLSVAISIDNELVYQNAMGLADVSLNKPAKVTTQYSVGSIAKPMTGIALMHLIKDKKAALADPLKQHVQGIDSKFAKINLAQLASHIAGIAHDTPERQILEFSELRDHQSPGEALLAFASHPLLFEPGTQFQYSSNGYILLSHAIEKIAEQDFNAYLKETVWQPLKMENTHFDISRSNGRNEATYYHSWSAEHGYQPATTKRDRSFLFGAGGYLSTPSDLVKMASALFQPAYLAPQFVDEMLTPVKLNSGEMNDDNYAIGWRVGKMPIGEGEVVKVAHHGGVTADAATAYLLVIPERRAAVAFATNMVPEKFWQMRGKTARLLVRWITNDFAEE